MKRLITFILLSSLFLFLILGWGKDIREVIKTPTMNHMLLLFFIIEVLFILSIFRYQRLGEPKVRVKSCLNKHLLVTGAFLVITQAAFTNYHYHGTGANELSDFLFYRLNTGVWTLLAFLQIYNFIRNRTFCAHGLSGPGITVLWEDIEKYHWESMETLYIECKNDLLFFKIKTRLRWSIPRGLRGEVEELLLERAPQ
jgi:hypothetical protein